MVVVSGPVAGKIAVRPARTRATAMRIATVPCCPDPAGCRVDVGGRHLVTDGHVLWTAVVKLDVVQRGCTADSAATCRQQGECLGNTFTLDAVRQGVQYVGKTPFAGAAENVLPAICS